jgi:hypothetical protein
LSAVSPSYGLNPSISIVLKTFSEKTEMGNWNMWKLENVEGWKTRPWEWISYFGGANEYETVVKEQVKVIGWDVCDKFYIKNIYFASKYDSIAKMILYKSVVLQKLLSDIWFMVYRNVTWI